MNLLRMDFVALRTRITIGFLSLCSCLAIAAALGYWGIQQGQQGARAFIAISHQTNRLMDLERLALLLQKHIDTYTSEGRYSAVLGVKKTLVAMRENLDQCQAAESDPTATRMLQKSVELIKGNEEIFQEIVTERTLRERLMTVDLLAISYKNHDRITRFLESGSQDTPSVKKWMQVLGHLQETEVCLFRYMQNYEQVWITKALADIKKADATITSINPNDTLAEHGGQAEEIRLNIREYEKIILRTTQAIQNYLHLQNVVMAGSTSEVLHTTKRLRADIEKRQQTIKSDLDRSSRKISTLVLGSTIAIVCLASLASFFVSQGITVPLSKMKDTFLNLAAGESGTPVPFLDYRDEIGDLAKAANIFKSKNLETERLLQQSRQLTADLDSSRRDLARSNDELERFVYTVSHDLKSPLVTSMGFIGIIRAKLEAGDAGAAAAHIEKLVGANKRMGQLISDLLELSRVGRVDLDIKETDLHALLDDFAAIHRARLRATGFTLHLKGPFARIWANESRLLQILENLLSNALKYAAESPVPRIEIGCRETPGHTEIYFKDNGPGIAPAFHEKIFGLFARLSSDKTGTGIGLAVVRKSMEFHGGKAWVESDTGQGACFWLSFPKKAGAPEPTKPPASP